MRMKLIAYKVHYDLGTQVVMHSLCGYCFSNTDITNPILTQLPNHLTIGITML